MKRLFASLSLLLFLIPIISFTQVQTTPAPNWDYPKQFDWDHSTQPNGVQSGTVGAMIFQGKYYFNRWNSTWVYRYNNNGTGGGPGTFLDSLSYVGQIRDLTTDGTYLYGGQASTTLYRFNANMGTVQSWNIPGAEFRAIAWDPNRGGFWNCGFNTAISCHDTSGTLIDSFAAPVGGKYGLAYDTISCPDSAFLWIWAQVGSNNELVKVHLPSKQVVGTYQFPQLGVNTGLAGGCEVQSDVVSGRVHILLNYQNSNLVAYDISPLPRADAGSDKGICSGDSVVIGGAPTARGCYQPITFSWSPSTGLSSATSSNPTATPTSTTSYVVTATDSLGNTSKDTVVVTVTPTPSTPTITPSGNQSMCPGDTIVLTSSPASTYSWSNGATTQSINVTFAGNYSVTVSDSLGCGTATSSSVNVSLLSAPPTPVVSPSGTQTICLGDSVQLSTSAFGNFAWNHGPTANNIWINTGGSYFVTVTGTNGCTAKSNVVVVNQINSSSVVISPTSPVNICQGDTAVLSTGNYVSYSWSTGSSSSSINVTTAGSYTVTITDSNGCTVTSNPTQVVVNTIPSPPSITPAGTTQICQNQTATLNSSYASGNTWSNGASTQSITVGTAGNYTCTHTDANGCTSLASAPVTIVVDTCTGFDDDLANAYHIKVWPNPAKDHLNLSLSLPFSDQLTVELMDLSGRRMEYMEFGNAFGDFQTNLDLESISSGLFFMTVGIGDKVFRYKILKMKE